LLAIRRSSSNAQQAGSHMIDMTAKTPQIQEDHDVAAANR
jgi:hypothetical protein